MAKNKYNIGQEVVENGKHYFIINFREIFGMYQYYLSKTKGGEFCFACGEFSIDYAVDNSKNNHEEDVSNPDLSFLSPTQPDETSEHSATVMNTTAAIMRQTIDGSESGIPENIARMVGSSLFFKPDMKFVKWLIKYADGRQIIDVGAGQGHLVRMIKMFGGKAIGLEPNFDQRRYIEQGKIKWGNDFDINEMLPWTIERVKGFINGLGSKALLIFARPCHSDFVVNGIRNMPNDMEALYITKPENVVKYNDLGEYFEKRKFIKHDGVSEDNEIVYSILKSRK